MKRTEIIELNGVEYTLELNRDSFIQIDKICNVQKSMEIIQKNLYDYVEDIDITQYDAVYFLSGLSGPECSFENAELYCKVNELGLLSLCRKLSTLTQSRPKIIFPSSRLVYRGGMRV